MLAYPVDGLEKKSKAVLPPDRETRMRRSMAQKQVNFERGERIPPSDYLESKERTTKDSEAWGLSCSLNSHAGVFVASFFLTLPAVYILKKNNIQKLNYTRPCLDPYR